MSENRRVTLWTAFLRHCGSPLYRQILLERPDIELCNADLRKLVRIAANQDEYPDKLAPLSREQRMHLDQRRKQILRGSPAPKRSTAGRREQEDEEEEDEEVVRRPRRATSEEEEMEVRFEDEGPTFDPPPPPPEPRLLSRGNTPVPNNRRVKIDFMKRKPTIQDLKELLKFCRTEENNLLNSGTEEEFLKQYRDHKWHRVVDESGNFYGVIVTQPPSAKNKNLPALKAYDETNFPTVESEFLDYMYQRTDPGWYREKAQRDLDIEVLCLSTALTRNEKVGVLQAVLDSWSDKFKPKSSIKVAIQPANAVDQNGVESASWPLISKGYLRPSSTIRNTLTNVGLYLHKDDLDPDTMPAIFIVGKYTFNKKGKKSESSEGTQATPLRPPIQEEFSPPRGLENIGNTCFANSALQFLLTLPIFKKAALDLGESERFARNMESNADITIAILRELKKVVEKMSQPGKVLCPRALVNLMQTRYDLERNVQQDAGEFIQYLVDIANTSGELEKKLGFVVLKKMRCVGKLRSGNPCPFGETVFDSIATVLVVPSNDETIEDSLKDPYNEAPRNGVCEICGHRNTQRVKTVAEPLQTVIITVNRTRQTNQGPGRPFTTHKDFSQVLYSERPIRIGKHRYEPKALIFHHGKSLDEGHYTAISKRGANWFEFSDNVVKRLPSMPVKPEKVVAFAFQRVK